MAQEYKIDHFEAGDFTDPHGNTWCDAHLEGVGAVKMVVKDPSKYSSGQTVYGSVEEQTSKAGKKYLRFKREQKPDGNYGGGQQTAMHNGFDNDKKSAYKDNSDGQRQGMCFNNAANFINQLADRSITSTPETWAKSVWTYANALYKLGDLGSDQSLKATSPSEPTQSGYDKFRAKAQEVKERVIEKQDDKFFDNDNQPSEAEWESMMASAKENSTVSLADVPEDFLR